MVNPNETNTARRNNDNKGQISSFSAEHFPARNPKHNAPEPNDDLMVSLANAYENKRARQVNEWEKLRMQNAPHFRF